MGNWEGYTPAEKDAAINNIMLRDKIGTVLSGVEDPLSWADEISAHPSTVNRLTTAREILRELFNDIAESIPTKK